MGRGLAQAAKSGLRNLSWRGNRSGGSRGRQALRYAQRANLAAAAAFRSCRHFPALFWHLGLVFGEKPVGQAFEAASITVPEPELDFDTHVTGTSTPQRGLAPTLDSAHHISDDLHAMGGKDFSCTSSAKDAARLKKQNMHSGNYLETLDLHQEVRLQGD